MSRQAVKRNDKSAIELPPLIVEEVSGKPYAYHPLGKYVVVAPGVCGGRPTIKYHRLDARYIVAFIRRGDSPQQLADDYEIPLAAIREAIVLAQIYDYEKSYA